MHHYPKMHNSIENDGPTAGHAQQGGIRTTLRECNYESEGGGVRVWVEDSSGTRAKSLG